MITSRRCRELAAAIALLALFPGCQRVPSRPPPAPGPLPGSFHGALAGIGDSAAVVGPKWWEAFGDPVLNRLVERALTANYDLQEADARLHEARALSLENDAGRGPSVAAIAEYRRQHLPSDLKNDAAMVDQFFVTGFDATWEADLFGRVRSLGAAAHASAEAQAAARGELAVTLAAEVARTYFECCAHQRQLALQKRVIELRGTALDLTRRRAALGTANAADVAAQREINRRRADLTDLQAMVSHSIQRLSVLTNQPADALAPMLAAAVVSTGEPAAPLVQSPAEVLRHRPDVRRAELELVASSAVEDAAQADLLPRLTFNGQLSFYAFGWGVGPHLSWDLFDRRRVKAREAQAGARADAAFARYRAAVLGAVADVENALVDLEAAKVRRDFLATGVEESARGTAGARHRTELGVANRMEILVAEQARAEQEAALAAQESVVRQGWVALFKALGGGWDSQAVAGPQ